MTPKPGDVVIVPFAGALGTKNRPSVVVSSDVYHSARPDIIVAVLTTNLAAAKGPTDYVIRDWRAAGLHSPSASRVYLNMVMPVEANRIGHLSDRDWQGVRQCLLRALG